MKTPLYFLPGVLTLALAMLALHTHVSLEQEHRRLKDMHLTHLTEYEEVTHEEAMLGVLIERIKSKERIAYWAIIALGLCGFLVVIINADQLNRLYRLSVERKRSLQLLEHRLAAMEATMDGIILIDSDLNITYLNKAMARILGIEKGQYDNQTWLNFFSHNQELESQEGKLPIVEAGSTWHGVLTLNVNEASQRIDMTLAPLDDGGMIGVARDVTEKLKAEGEKKDMQSQLYQAQKMEAVGRLAGGIAHDFNNILAAMNGYAEFLVEDLEEGSSEHGFANNILQAGVQARSLVDKILAFSRHRGSDFEAMNLMTPVEESISMLKASLPKRIEMHTDFNLDAVPIEGNATQISQVLMNLCVNAKDAMQHGRGQIHLGVEEFVPNKKNTDQKWLLDDVPDIESMPLTRIEEFEGGVTELYLSGLAAGQKYACLYVVDTGCGMSRAVMEHVFEPFFTTKPVDKGTGLGLATAHGVVTAHKGALKIRSSIGHGTRFELYFPMLEMDALQGQGRAADSVYVSSGGKILLIDDQPEVGQVTASMLERLGYEYLYVQSAMEAMEALADNADEFDLVLTDHNMPKMTGLELVQELQESLPHMPVILLSGYSAQKLQDLMDETPAIRETLRKPVSKDKLGEVLANVLSDSDKALKHAV